MTSSTIALLLLASAALVAADFEVVQWKACPTEPGAVDTCTIKEVRVNPCKEASTGKACNLKKGEDAFISFDFVPKFEATKVESHAYWANQLVDLPLMGMESDACKVGTTCPLKKDAHNSYTIQLPISKKFPTRPFDVKWKLWNVEKENELCCFILKINLQM